MAAQSAQKDTALRDARSLIFTQAQQLETCNEEVEVHKDHVSAQEEKIKNLKKGDSFWEDVKEVTLGVAVGVLVVFGLSI